jgi:phage-related protein
MIVRELVNIIGFKVDAKQLNMSQQKFDKFKKRLKSIGIVAGTVMVAVGAIAKKSLDLFDQQAEAVANVEASLKSTGESAGRTLEQLTKQASKLQEETFFGDETILQNVTAQMLTFTNITEDRFDRTQKVVLDVTAKLNGLKASGESVRAMSIMLGKALNDPVANLGALSRSGIQFSKDQKKVIKSLVESGKLAEAQGMILAELERQYGGTAEALAKTGKGAQLQIQNQIGDILETIGQALSPLRLEFLKLIKDLLASGFVEIILDTVKSLLPLIRVLLKALPTIFKLLSPVIKIFSNLLGVVAKILGKFIIPLIEQLTKAFTPLLEDFGVILEDLFTMLEPILSIVSKELIMSIKTGLIPLIAQMKIFFAILKPIMKLLSVILTPFLKALDSVLEVINQMIDQITELFYDVIGKAVDWVIKKLAAVGEAFKGIFTGISDFFAKIINSVIDGINFLIQATNKVAKTRIELIDRLDPSKMLTKDITNNNQRQTNVSVKNDIRVNGMKDRQQVKATIEKAAGSVFNLELKKLLIESGGL